MFRKHGHRLKQTKYVHEKFIPPRLKTDRKFCYFKAAALYFPIKNDKKNTHVYLLLVELNKKSHTCSTSV